MAEIHVERKRRSPLPLILGLLAAALLALLLLRSCGGGEDEVEGTGTVVDTMTASTSAPVAAAPMAMDTGAQAVGGTVGGTPGGTGWIAGVLAGTSAGQMAGGDGIVPETPSDRGFWIEENGQRVFAILAERMEQIRDVDPGQRVRISNARVLRGTDAGQIPQDVDAEARQTAQGQQYFLLVPASGVQIVSGGNTTPD